jgi:hypothetical protein
MSQRFKKLGKTITIILVTIIIAFATPGCVNREYEGEYPELFTVAINSLLGTRSRDASHRTPDPIIIVIEEDDYGRVLFFYARQSVVTHFAFIISQKSDGEYVYYYPHYNFISFEYLSEIVGDRGMTAIERGAIPPEIFEELKVRNDWNQELNLERSVKARIARQEEDGHVRDRTLLELYNIALGEDAWRDPLRFHISFLIADEYGRSVYLGRGSGIRRDSPRYIVMLFQPDGSFDEERSVMELYDTHNYQTALREFKELNGWNQPFEGSTSISVLPIVGLVVIVGVGAFVLVKLYLRKKVGSVKPLTLRKPIKSKGAWSLNMKPCVKVAIYINVPTLLVMTAFNLIDDGSWAEPFLFANVVLYVFFPATLLLAHLMIEYFLVLYIIPITIILAYLIYSLIKGLKPQKAYKVLYFVLSMICMVLFTITWLAAVPIVALVSYVLSGTVVSIYKRLRRS